MRDVAANTLASSMVSSLDATEAAALILWLPGTRQPPRARAKADRLAAAGGKEESRRAAGTRQASAGDGSKGVEAEKARIEAGSREARKKTATTIARS